MKHQRIDTQLFILYFLFMIVRVNRSQSKFKTEDHRKMKDLIEQLQF